MPGKPYQSSLIPYEDEILSLRHHRPPASYARIAEVLRQTHQILVRREAIFKFIRVRSRGRKVYALYRSVSPKKPKSALPIAPPADPLPALPPKPKFEFEYSERYNLKRLPPEEAAAIRKKLEAEGH
jgi:hypothetical protein